jgi:CheY-like chemotaxis protein
MYIYNNIYLYVFYDILGVTGNALPADVDYFLDSGANAVLTKPVDTEKLKALFSLK